MNAAITPEAIAQVKADWPAWDDVTIIRHLQQRQRLVEIAQQQRAQRLMVAGLRWGDR